MGNTKAVARRLTLGVRGRGGGGEGAEEERGHQQRRHRDAASRAPSLGRHYWTHPAAPREGGKKRGNGAAAGDSDAASHEGAHLTGEREGGNKQSGKKKNAQIEAQEKHQESER